MQQHAADKVSGDSVDQDQTHNNCIPILNPRDKPVSATTV